MPGEVEAVDVAEALLTSVGLLVRRVGQLPNDDTLTMPERSALKRLDQVGPSTSAELARGAQISPQSMGTTLAALAQRGVVRRDRDSTDGRRVVLSITETGRKLLRNKRSTRGRELTAALTGEFTPAELKRLSAAVPLIERLARSIQSTR